MRTHSSAFLWTATLALAGSTWSGAYAMDGKQCPPRRTALGARLIQAATPESMMLGFRDLDELMRTGVCTPGAPDVLGVDFWAGKKLIGTRVVRLKAGELTKSNEQTLYVPLPGAIGEPKGSKGKVDRVTVWVKDAAGKHLKPARAIDSGSKL